MITGASSGLGEALAHEFYRRGCQVVLCARRRHELERVRTELLKTHTTVPILHPIVVTMDLTDTDSFTESIGNILELTNRIDILVNNGGISHRGNVIDTKLDVDVKIMLVNYIGAVALTKGRIIYWVSRVYFVSINYFYSCVTDDDSA